MTPEQQAAALAREVEANGFCLIRDLLDPRAVLQTRAELVALLDADYALKAPHGIPWNSDFSTKYPSFHDGQQHNLFFPSVHSPGLARLMEQIVTHPAIVGFMDRVLGKHYRLRVDYVRRLTGENDWVDEFQLPHEWHRDIPGAFTFGIYFDDVTPPGSGATAAIPGTHWQPYDPRYDILLGEDSLISQKLFLAGNPARIGRRAMRYAVFSRLLRDRLRANVRELSGRPGDIYFFFNDVWHGRAPNVHGTRNVVVRFNGFPTDFACTENIPLPVDAAMDRLPSGLRARYAREQPTNADPTTLVRRMNDRRRPRPDLFSAAALEKRALVHIGERAGWLRARLHADPAVVPAGQSVTARWSDIPRPTGGDLIYLYPAAAPNRQFLSYRYTNGTAAAGGAGAETGQVDIPLAADLAPGPHELRLFANNSFALLATASFTVAPAATSDAAVSAGPASARTP